MSDQFDEARVKLVLRHPFFASLALQLPEKEVPAGVLMALTGYPTAAVVCRKEGEHLKSELWYCKEFVEKLNRGQRMGLMAHEVLHLSLGHPFPWRRGHRDKNKWDAACDYVVNLIVRDAGLELPPHGLIDDKFRDMTVEQVYNLLPDQKTPDACHGMIEIIVIESPNPQSKGKGGKGNGKGKGQPEKQDDKDKAGGKGKGDKKEGEESEEDKKKREAAQQQEKEKTKGKGGGTIAEDTEAPEDGEGDPDDGEGDEGDDEPEEDEGEGGEGEDEQDDEGEGEEQEPGGGQKQHQHPMSEGVGKELEDKWKNLLVRAVMMAKAQGRCPAGLDRMVEDLIQPKIPWQTLLERYLSEVLRSDYDWTRCDRRYLGGMAVVGLDGNVTRDQAIYLPDLYNEGADIVVAVDTSGSIGQKELKRFVSEVVGMLRAKNVRSLRLMGCDAAVSYDEVLKPTDPLPHKWNLGGGGGTDFTPVFDRIEETSKPPPKLLVYMTDMMGTFPSEAPHGMDVIWLRTSNYEPPFGRAIDYPMDEQDEEEAA